MQSKNQIAKTILKAINNYRAMTECLKLDHINEKNQKAIENTNNFCITSIMNRIAMHNFIEHSGMMKRYEKFLDKIQQEIAKES